MIVEVHECGIQYIGFDKLFDDVFRLKIKTDASEFVWITTRRIDTFEPVNVTKELKRLEQEGRIQVDENGDRWVMPNRLF